MGGDRDRGKGRRAAHLKEKAIERKRQDCDRGRNGRKEGEGRRAEQGEGGARDVRVGVQVGKKKEERGSWNGGRQKKGDRSQRQKGS